MLRGLQIAIIGYSITSHWNNKYATLFRGMVRELNFLGNRVFFLEHKVPSHAYHRDLYRSLYCDIGLYKDTDKLFEQYVDAVISADMVILGSGVQEGDRVAEWLLDKAKGKRVFYDIDAPDTVRQLQQGACRYLRPELIPEFDLYLSGAGGPILDLLERQFGAQRAEAFYPSVDPYLFYEQEVQTTHDLGFAGSFEAAQFEQLYRCLIVPAQAMPNGSFQLVGAGYPEFFNWPDNLHRQDYLPPGGWLDFYNQLRFWLDLPTDSEKELGYAPSVQLLEAIACGRPVISAGWPGLDHFFEPGKEIFQAQTPEEVLHILYGTSRKLRTSVADRARERLLANHTTTQRARELINHFYDRSSTAQTA